MSDALLAVDPGARSIAWSLFVDERLTACALDRDDDLALVTHAAVKHLRDFWPHARAAVELPQVYQQRLWRGDPNDLIAVALTVGRVVQECEHRGIVAELIRPHAWKGSAPKAVMCRRIVDKLDAGEQDVLRRVKVPASLRHNVVDAIGVGLWKLGRLARYTR